MKGAFLLAEREGFEPPIQLPVYLISSQTHSTTLPSLHIFRQVKRVDALVASKSDIQNTFGVLSDLPLVFLQKTPVYPRLSALISSQTLITHSAISPLKAFVKTVVFGRRHRDTTPVFMKNQVQSKKIHHFLCVQNFMPFVIDVKFS